MAILHMYPSLLGETEECLCLYITVRCIDIARAVLQSGHVGRVPDPRTGQTAFGGNLFNAITRLKPLREISHIGSPDPVQLNSLVGSCSTYKLWVHEADNSPSVVKPIGKRWVSIL
jgi:hypothetical protein